MCICDGACSIRHPTHVQQGDPPGSERRGGRSQALAAADDQACVHLAVDDQACVHIAVPLFLASSPEREVVGVNGERGVQVGETRSSRRICLEEGQEWRDMHRRRIHYSFNGVDLDSIGGCSKGGVFAMLSGTVRANKYVHRHIVDTLRPQIALWTMQILRTEKVRCFESLKSIWYTQRLRRNRLLA